MCSKGQKGRDGTYNCPYNKKSHGIIRQSKYDDDDDEY